jgi:cytochrome c2
MMRTIFHTLILFALMTSAATAQEEESSDFKKRAGQFNQLCSKCHTVGMGDRVGPDLKDVTTRRPRQWLIRFITKPGELLDNDPEAQRMLKKYGGVRMTDLGVSAEDAEGLLQYIEVASEGGGPGGPAAVPLKPRNLAFEVPGPDEKKGVHLPGIVLFALMMVGTIGLWIGGWPKSAQVVLVLALAVAYWSFGGRAHHKLVGDHQGYEPVQPIEFSHKMHAGDLGMECLYCHHNAEKGPVAGVPSVNICMNCHDLVKNRVGNEGVSPELQKLFDVWDSKDTDNPKSLEWVRVHRLADFVTFNHKVHVQNGVLCQTCHGPIQEMERVRQASDLSMGWCLNCHRHKGAEPPTHWQRAEGPLDCAVCHQ